MLALALIAVAAILWQVLPMIGALDREQLPPLGDVVGALAKEFQSGEIWPHLTTTVGEIVLGFAIALPVAVGLGVVLSFSDYWRRVFEPMISFFVGIPKSVFLPLFILGFGIGQSQKVLFGVFQAVFVITVVTVTGMRQVPPQLLTVSRALGAGRWSTFWHVYRPSITPLVIEGARLGMIFNVTGIVLAEMYVSREGLGQLVTRAGSSQNVEQLLALVLLVSGISIAINELLGAYERHVCRWRNS